jgi:hypothetical protein
VGGRGQQNLVPLFLRILAYEVAAQGAGEPPTEAAPHPPGLFLSSLSVCLLPPAKRALAKLFKKNLSFTTFAKETKIFFLTVEI